MSGRSAVEKLERHYGDIESGWQVRDRSADYRSLVTSANNAEQPFHRWFHLKEAFAHDLVGRLMQDESQPGAPPSWASVLDPFSGGGTTCLSVLAMADAQTQGPSPMVLGVERNPALRVVSDAKLLGFQLGASLFDAVSRAAQSIDYSPSLDEPKTASVTLRNSRYFDQKDAGTLLSVSRQIRRIEDEAVRTVLQCALLSSIEGASRLRRDGRALRYEPNKIPLSPRESLEAKVQVVLEDLRTREPQSVEVGSCRVISGDARVVGNEPDVKGRCFERIVFSPPYPNNIDYTEVYKLENWILGAWRDVEEMRAQRLSTLRSHPSVIFPEEYEYLKEDFAMDVAALVDPLLECVADDRYARGRRQLIQGYVDDMYQVLRTCRSVVADHGRLYCIVGNSVHGRVGESFVVAADVLIGALSELTGWRVSEIRVARTLTRRTSASGYVRESVVVLEPA